MLQLEFRRSTLFWILGVALVVGLGLDLVRLATHRRLDFPVEVVHDRETVELKHAADSIMQARAVAARAPVNVNAASSAELETLDGIGPVLARRIVQHREQHGPFASVDDLNAVPGIGPGRLAAIRSRCAVE